MSSEPGRLDYRLVLSRARRAVRARCVGLALRRVGSLELVPIEKKAPPGSGAKSA
jgi:hypothetical protein